MNSPNLQQRAIEWKTLESLLRSYEILYDEEQAFLMEVIPSPTLSKATSLVDL